MTEVDSTFIFITFYTFSDLPLNPSWRWPSNSEHWDEHGIGWHEAGCGPHPQVCMVVMGVIFGMVFMNADSGN